MKTSHNVSRMANLAKSLAKANTNGLMDQFTQVIGSKITSKEKESTSGLTAEFTPDNGRKIKSMEVVSMSGPMADGTKEHIKRIVNTAMVHLLGLMARRIRDSGSMESNMGKEDSPTQKAKVS